MKLFLDAVALPLQMASCFYLAGVISIIQLIHYPSFAQIDRKHFQAFHRNHTRSLGIIAGFAMCVELASAFWILKSENLWSILNLIGVILLWIITFFISVPLHNRLALGFEEKYFQQLVKTNWFRTALWMIRSLGFLIWMTSFTPDK